jgi:DNA polymerase
MGFELVSNIFKVERLRALNAELEMLNHPSLAELSSRTVPGEGNPDSPVVFIGEAPGKEEDLQRQPFIGAAGRVLNSALEAAGWRSDVYVTNIVKRRPPLNRRPWMSEVEVFLPHLMRELEIVGPKVVCLLGTVAVNALTGKALAEMVGKILAVDGRIYFCTYHPAAVIYNAKLERVFLNHIMLLRRLVESTE